MSGADNRDGLVNRRYCIGRIAAMAGGLVAACDLSAQSAQSSSSAGSESGESSTRTALHQEVELNAPPARVYEILLDSKQFGASTHMAAEIHGEDGGAFSMFGGMIVGRNVELVPNQRIVQAWRPTHWGAGVYSIVKFEFTASGGKTRVVLDHTGFPEGDFDSLSAGWKEHYWEPLKKFLG